MIVQQQQQQQSEKDEKRNVEISKDEEEKMHRKLSTQKYLPFFVQRYGQLLAEL